MAKDKKSEKKQEYNDNDLFKITTKEGVVLERKWSNLKGPKYKRLLSRGWKVEAL